MSIKDITAESTSFKPFKYPWAVDYWKVQQQVHWLPDEVPMAEDVIDWNKKLTPQEKNLVSQILRFFTQADTMVADGYVNHYLPKIKNNEVRMMMATFASMETIHQIAYAHLLDTLGFPESEFSIFMEYAEMKDKYDYLKSINVEDKKSLAESIAIFSAFTEGLSLFASFAILLSFPRRGLLKGAGQIVSWSIRDETIHANGMIKVFHELCNENPEILDDDLKAKIYKAASTSVEHEDKFIDLAFEQGDLQNLTANEVKKFIRYVGNRRLIQLGMKPIFNVGDQNPLPFFDEMTNVQEFANFFEQRATEYSRGASQGDWGDAFDE